MSDRPRSSYLGGTDASAIVGANPYQTPFEVYISKVTEQITPLNPAMEWGTRLESVIAQKYSDVTKHTLAQPQTLFHSAHSFIGGTPDYLIQDDPNLLLEVKTASESQLDLLDGEGVPIWGFEGSDIVPLQYLVQCQWYMGLTGRRRADLAVFFLGASRDFRIYSIKFDPELYSGLLRKAVEFWNNFIIPRKEPEITNGNSSLVTEYLSKKALAGGKVLDLNQNNDSQELLDYSIVLEKISARRKECETYEDDYKQAILTLMAEAGAQKIKGSIDGASFTLAIQGGGEGKEIIDWQSVAMTLAKNTGLLSIPDELIEANTIRCKPKNHYLRAYFDGVRKARALSIQQPELSNKTA